MDVTVKFKDICSPFASGLTDKVACILLEDAIVTADIGFGQITSGYMLAKSEMIALLVMCLYGDYQVSYALTIAQLTKHQRKELVPTCEVLHIIVTSILFNDVTKLVIVQELNQLCENVF